jgi:hypothetical protein
MYYLAAKSTTSVASPIFLKFSDNQLDDIHIYFYFLSVKMKQCDWPRNLSERGGFLHSARSETQLPALLWSETIFKRKNLPKTFEKHSLTIVSIRK